MRRYAALGLWLFLAACATTKPVPMSEPRRVVGTDNDVRIDAEVVGDRLGPNVTVPLQYDITNNRRNTILIADLLPESTYDPDTRTVTINIGSEIPGEEFLPRLIPIRPGERKSFKTAAHVTIVANMASPWVPRPNALRLKVNFLSNPEPFQMLIAIPEKAVRDRALAAQLFTKWVEGNETVFTNSLPMRWGSLPSDEPADQTTPGRRRRGSI
ncbi:MAG TPA: hypothetical protein VKU62_08445 [Thermoanaerobaculia bacterium]|nr:hypothetical protein [Thermoanaerobaculia bacterium]